MVLKIHDLSKQNKVEEQKTPKLKVETKPKTVMTEAEKQAFNR